MDTVWEIQGYSPRHYRIEARVYRNAHDERTYVVNIENMWHAGPYVCHMIRFGFLTKRETIAWAKKQRPKIANIIRRWQCQARKEMATQ